MVTGFLPLQIFARVSLVALAVSALGGCSTTVDSLGYDPVDAGTDADADAPDADVPDADVPDADVPDADVPDADAGGEGGAGGSGPADPVLTPLVGPTNYPNAFGELLGKTELEITEKIEATFQQLFYGALDEVIYYEVAPDQAYIRDILHGDIRTEGVGFGMLITVQLDRKEAFDRLWRYAKAEMASTGADVGYFDSRCDTPEGMTRPCVDPFGYQQFTMALIFAHDQWGSSGELDYEADALALLHVMRHKGEEDIAATSNVTSTFDTESKLVFDEPRQLVVHTRPSQEMPAYYELWADATGDDFWRQAAAAGRAYIERVAHATTGLTPGRAYLSGMLMDNWRNFGTEAYRTHLNVTLDGIWVGESPWPVEHSDRLIGFFSGLAVTGTSYELDGTPVDPAPELALVAANGIAALTSTRPERVEFVQAVWNMTPTVGQPRYYSGLLDLLALLTLSGRMKVI